MTEVILEQILYFGVMILCGGIFCMGYAVLLIFRRLIRHRRLWLYVEDMLYGAGGAIPVFVVCLRYGDGVIRWYGLIGFFGGALAVRKIYRTLVLHCKRHQNVV